MVLATTILLFFIIFCVYFVWSRRRFYAFASKMPGPMGLPFLGIVHKICNMANTLYVLPELAAQCKSKTIFFWLGPFPVVYTKEPKIAEQFLNNPDCINKSLVYDAITESIGAGLLTSKSPTWNIHRKLLTPSFNYKVLLSFFPIFNRISRELCGKFDLQVDRGEVNIYDLLINLGMKSSFETTMGSNFEQGSADMLMDCFEKVFNLTANRVLKPWLRSAAIFQLTSMYKPLEESRTTIFNFVKKVVINKIKILDQQKSHEDDNSIDSTDIKKTNNIFIDRVIKIYQNNEFTLNDAVCEANLIVFAASETSATTVLSALIFLAMHPQYQEKVFEEIITFFPDKDFEVNYEDFKNLVYLDMCINETMRLAPGIPLIARDTTNDVALSKDMVIPKGTQIIVDIFNIHRDEDLWGPDAKSFNPDNFLPANLEDKHKCSFMPFSKGQRNCLGWQYAGMLMKVALVQILRKYRFSTSFQFRDLRFMESVALKYEKVPNLKVHRRTDS